MATYEDDHNLPASSTSLKPVPHRPRPDLSNFFSSLSITPSTPSTQSTDPTSSASSAFTSLARAWQQSIEGNDVLESLIEQLIEEAQGGTKVKGVDQQFLDGLERIPKKELVEADICPICNTSFLLDQYPLVVRLPCHKSHVFDLECISPWLKLHTTCPLDRIDLTKKKTPPPPPVDEEEEDWDDNYG
ncbi:uncharacterized protein DFL_000581 [Arthrobotrys flagrans]|uniref:RING-type domain-containing protein n=1 Tax=Arthrobotrys flagrans TaxID=97331 RepID=A0A437AEM8_ARTFL|nr:hypothetical protein DFL_000581 [Arthrobotrys flagrans]